jgi:hypothetical protein
MWALSAVGAAGYYAFLGASTFFAAIQIAIA